MHLLRRLLWSLQPLVLVLVPAPVRGLGQPLVQELEPVRGLGQQLVPGLEPVRAQGLVQRLRHRNQEQRLQVSSWHRASTSRFRSSTLHHSHCANCEFPERLLQKQMLLLRPMRQFC
jgi:hypothetical protein